MPVRGWIYDRALLGLTVGWYGAVLDRLAPGTRLLDVGIGTAGALLAHRDRVRALDLRVTGVDVDLDYVRRARRRVARAGLADRVEIRHEPLEEHQGGPYDAVYFAASFMLLADPAAGARHAVRCLAPGGRVFFTQTFQERRSATLERLKPKLVRFTGIDFGRVTYEAEFLETLHTAGLEVVEHVVLDGRKRRTSRLVVAVPRASSEEHRVVAPGAAASPSG